MKERVSCLMRIAAGMAVLAMMVSAWVGSAEDFPEMEAPPVCAALRSVRIRAAGDLMVHTRQLTIARQADGSYDFHPQYALVTEALADADYTVANLETTLGMYGKQPYSGFPRFNTPESLMETIRDAGIDFLTLANNHMLDRYFEGMCNTVSVVDAYGLAHAGANRTPEERDKPVIVEVNGIRIGMLCYTQMTNGMENHCSSDVKTYGVNYLRSASFEADVAKLREAGAEVIIAMPHWGQEYRRTPEANTVSLAKKLIAAGADVILGSHPHMVQPVEYLTVSDQDGRTRTGLVAYSLGNFISNMSRQYTDSGIILDFTIREKQDGGFEAVDAAVVPIFNWRRDSMIQAVPSMKYYDNPPEGMNSARYSRMKASLRELRALIDDGIPFLPE